MITAVWRDGALEIQVAPEYHLLPTEEKERLLTKMREKLAAIPDVRVNEAAELSSSERFVLTRVLQGKTSREIAQEMVRSTRTVETFRSRAFRKLGVNRTALAVIKEQE